MKSRIIEQLEFQVEVEGFQPGSAAFAERLVALRVAKCQEMRGLESCSRCPVLDECALAREFRQIVRRSHE